MSVLTVSEVSTILLSEGVVTRHFTSHDIQQGSAPINVGNADLGRMSYLYVSLPDMETRTRVERGFVLSDDAILNEIRAELDEEIAKRPDEDFLDW